MQTDNSAGTAIDKKNNINTRNVLDKWSSGEQQNVQQRNSFKSNDKATLNIARKDKNLRKLIAGKSSVRNNWAAQHDWSHHELTRIIFFQTRAVIGLLC